MSLSDYRRMVCSLLVLLSVTVMAQEGKSQFSIDAQLRTRGECNNGAIFPRVTNEPAAYFANERARLSMNYSCDNLELRLSAQHTGVWGQDDIKTRNGRVAMNEAWARLNLGSKFFAQVGRQQLAYDDERILGSLDWNVAGNWHDALRLGFVHNQTTVHAVLALNQSAENIRTRYLSSGGMPYKLMGMLWWHQDFDVQPVGVSVLAMNLGIEAGNTKQAKTQHMQTFGFYANYHPEGLEVTGSFYVQTGKEKSGKSVAALMGSLQGSYSITPDWSARAGYDYLSGNDGRNVNQHAFNTLYGTHHKFLGAMDYFTGLVDCGIQDIQLGGTIRVLRPVTISLDYHALFGAESYKGNGKMLGHEVDLQASMMLQKDVTVHAGYSRMFGTSSMDALMGGNHRERQDWLWVQLNVNPCIFLTMW